MACRTFKRSYALLRHSFGLCLRPLRGPLPLTSYILDTLRSSVGALQN